MSLNLKIITIAIFSFFPLISFANLSKKEHIKDSLYLGHRPKFELFIGTIINSLNSHDTLRFFWDSGKKYFILFALDSLGNKTTIHGKWNYFSRGDHCRTDGPGVLDLYPDGDLRGWHTLVYIKDSTWKDKELHRKYIRRTLVFDTLIQSLRYSNSKEAAIIKKQWLENWKKEYKNWPIVTSEETEKFDREVKLLDPLEGPKLDLQGLPMRFEKTIIDH